MIMNFNYAEGFFIIIVYPLYSHQILFFYKYHYT